MVLLPDSRQGQTIMGATYGIPIESRQDPLIQLADEYMGAVSLALSPAMWLVNPFWWRMSASMSYRILFILLITYNLQSSRRQPGQ